MRPILTERAIEERAEARRLWRHEPKRMPARQEEEMRRPPRGERSVPECRRHRPVAVAEAGIQADDREVGLLRHQSRSRTRTSTHNARNPSRQVIFLPSSYVRP